MSHHSARTDERELATDTDALVAAFPSEVGIASIRFEKGARIYTGERVGDWIVAKPVSSAVSPPEGMHFWIPRRALR